jgi:hypothetical protein
LHPRGQGPAGPVPVEAGDAILEHSKKAGVALAGSCGRARLAARELAVHPARVMLCRVDELADLTHDIRDLRLAIEAGGR